MPAYSFEDDDDESADKTRCMRHDDYMVISWSRWVRVVGKDDRASSLTALVSARSSLVVKLESNNSTSTSIGEKKLKRRSRVGHAAQQETRSGSKLGAKRERFKLTER